MGIGGIFPAEQLKMVRLPALDPGLIGTAKIGGALWGAAMGFLEGVYRQAIVRDCHVLSLPSTQVYRRL